MRQLLKPQFVWWLLRTAGLVAIAALLPIRLPERFPTAPLRAPVMPPGIAERFAPWAGAGPDQRWSGCWLSEVQALTDVLSLEIRCPEDRQLVATLTRRPSGASAVADDCASRTVAGRFFACTVDGTVTGTLREALLTKLREVLSVVIVSDPFVRSSPPPETVGEQQGYDAESVATWALIGFLWLVVTGAFGFGSVARSDWPALLPLLLALFTRECLALHSIGEIEPQFYMYSVGNRHSAVQWLFSLFFARGADPFATLMHVNGVLGSLATLPLYLWVRQRTSSRFAATMAAAFFAVHPIVASLAPTDNPYSLMMFSWFSGLALLSEAAVAAGPLCAGGCLLGLAAACRPDAFLCVIASLFLLDLRVLLDDMRRHAEAAAVAITLVSALLAFHFWNTLPPVMPAGGTVHMHDPIELRAVLRGAFGWTTLTPWLMSILTTVGAVAGLENRRLRVGFGAALASGLLILPYPESFRGGWTVYHRYVPSCAMVAVGAGIGAAALTTLFRRWMSPLAAGLPAVAAVGYVLVSQASTLREMNAIHHEFAMLRDHLAPGGQVQRDCVLLTMSPNPKGDVDIHEFSWILPGMEVSHCNRRDEDCLGVARDRSCVYYVRPLSCYYLENRPPFSSEASGNDPLAWLDPSCRALEESLVMSPIEERNVRPLEVWHFDEKFRLFPPVATIGLYRVAKVNLDERHLD